MDKTIAGVLAAVGSLIPLGAAQAAVTPAEVDRAMSAGSFSDLLQSVPNAAAILKAADEQRATVNGPAMRVAYHHHHHHHHHWWYHHHHHHHWWWYHHHHHHHHFYY